MKKYLIIFVLFIATPLMVSSLYAQTYPKNTKEDVTDPQIWFSYKKINNNIYQISDHGLANIYLVVGKDSVLIIDTGMGVADLKGYVKSIVKLPIIVVNTHGHGDHAGGDNQFDKVYANPDDFYLIRKPRLKVDNDKFMKHFMAPDETIPNVKQYQQNAELIPIKDGHVFDLGNRKVEVITVPGHTKGSICLLDRKTGTLFTGDNDNSQTWLFLKDCTPLEVYKMSLEKLIERKSEFKLLLPGHGDPYDAGFLDEHLICVNNILSGKCQPQDITTFAGSGKLCVYKRANIIFNPNNLFVKK